MSTEKRSFLASEDEEKYSAYSVKPRTFNLARRLLCNLSIGLLLLGTLVFKLSDFIVHSQVNGSSQATDVVEVLTEQPEKNGKFPQVDPLSPRHTTWKLKAMDCWLSSQIYEDISARLLLEAVRL